MSEPSGASSSELPRVTVPKMCAYHDYDLIRSRLKLRPTDQWRGYYATAQVLLLNWVLVDPRVVARTEDKMETVSRVLAEIGCLACFDKHGYSLAVIVLKQGLEHASLVAYGKIDDKYWPIKHRARKCETLITKDSPPKAD